MALLDPRFGENPTQPAASGEPDSSTVIDVADVTPASTSLPEVPYKTAVECLLTSPMSPESAWMLQQLPAELRPAQPAGPLVPVEACSRYHGQLVANVHFHPVMAAVDLAFREHRPLVLSPDMLWLLIAQGFANHVNVHAEELRPRLVKHSGKPVVVVRRDDFFKGSPENPWPEVFAEFSRHIREHIGEATHDLLLPAFSTTGSVECAAAQVVLLDAMQSFFAFEVHTMCGIPQIVLEGTLNDWQELANRARKLEAYGLNWWMGVLVPILDEFVAAARGARNLRFWQSIYKQGAESGGPYATGWITAFFPYLKDWQTGLATHKNPWLERGGSMLQELLDAPVTDNRERWIGGLTIEQIPSGLARCRSCGSFSLAPPTRWCTRWSSWAALSASSKTGPHSACDRRSVGRSEKRPRLDRQNPSHHQSPEVAGLKQMGGSQLRIRFDSRPL